MNGYRLVTEQIRTEYRDELNRILAETDRMLEGEYVFRDTWDMEPCSEPVLNRSIRWDVRYHGDPEWSYMFCRFDYLYKFIISYELTGDQKYIAFALRLIRKWQKDNTKYLNRITGAIAGIAERHRNLAHRTLDVSIRAANTCDFLFYCDRNGLLSARNRDAIRKNLLRCVRFIYASDSEPKWFSNWGIIENANALYVCDFLGEEAPGRTGYDRLVRLLGNQMRPDGSQIESSFLYLAQILLAVSRYAAFGRSFDREPLVKALRAGYGYILATVMPDNRIPNLGDSDPADISDLMYTAALVCGDSGFLAGCTRKPGMEYLFRFRNRLPERGDSVSGSVKRPALMDQAVYSDPEKGFYAFCSNTPRMVSGHKHYDYLSFIVYLSGQPLFTDCGRYTYLDGEHRRFFVGPEAHNTVRLDGTACYEYRSGWVTRHNVYQNRTAGMVKDGIFSARMSATFGYNEYTVYRFFTYIPSFGIIVSDLVEGKAGCRYESFLNLHPSVKVKDHALVLQDGTSLYLSVSGSPVSRENRKVCYSEKYNELSETTQIAFAGDDVHLVHYCFAFTDGYGPVTAETGAAGRQITYRIPGPDGGQTAVALDYRTED